MYEATETQQNTASRETICGDEIGIAHFFVESRRLYVSRTKLLISSAVKPAVVFRKICIRLVVFSCVSFIIKCIILTCHTKTMK